MLLNYFSEESPDFSTLNYKKLVQSIFPSTVSTVHKDIWGNLKGISAHLSTHKSHSFPHPYSVNIFLYKQFSILFFLLLQFKASFLCKTKVYPSLSHMAFSRLQSILVSQVDVLNHIPPLSPSFNATEEGR